MPVRHFGVQVRSDVFGRKARSYSLLTFIARVLRMLQHFYTALRGTGERYVSSMGSWSIRRRGYSVTAFVADMLECCGRRIACIEAMGMASDR